MFFCDAATSFFANPAHSALTMLMISWATAGLAVCATAGMRVEIGAPTTNKERYRIWVLRWIDHLVTRWGLSEAPERLVVRPGARASRRIYAAVARVIGMRR